MHIWKDIYKEIATKIKNNMPQVQWIDLWHEQVNFLTEELPFETPAVFIGFTTLGTADRGKHIQDVNLQVDIRLFHETFSDTYMGSMNQDTALDYMDNLTELHALFHGKSGTSFSDMGRVGMGREDSGGAGNLYNIQFRCLVTDESAAKMFTETVNPDAEVDVERARMLVEGYRSNWGFIM